MEFLQLYTKQPVLHWSNQTLEFFLLMLYNFFHVNQMRIKQNIFFSIFYNDLFFYFIHALPRYLLQEKMQLCYMGCYMYQSFHNQHILGYGVIVMSKDSRETKSLQHIIRTTEMIILFRKMKRLANWQTKKRAKNNKMATQNFISVWFYGSMQSASGMSHRIIITTHIGCELTTFGPKRS